MSQNVRNVLIVLALALAVYAVPGGGETASFIGSLLSTAFIAIFALIGYRLYREHRVTIFSLGDRYRLTLYAALGGIILAMAVRRELWLTAGGTLLWAAAIGAAAYALVLVYRHYRAYAF